MINLCLMIDLRTQREKLIHEARLHLTKHRAAVEALTQTYVTNDTRTNARLPEPVRRLTDTPYEARR